MMRLIALLAAAPVLAGAASAQQVWLPESMDQSLQPGMTMPGTTFVGARGTTACDDFDRPNSTNMGPDWTEMSGDQQILNNEAANLGTGNSWMLHNSVTSTVAGTVVEFDLDPNAGGSSRYGAAVIGYDPITGEDIYVKVQNQTGLPGYSNYGFYHGFNGGGYNGWGGFGSLPYQSPGGHVTVSVDAAGDVVTLEIDEDYDGNPEITLTAPGLIASGLPGLLGDQCGAGFWSAGSMDNWEVNGGCAPTGPSLTATGTAGGTMTFDYAGFAGGEQIATVYGPAGSLSGNAPCGSVTVDLVPLNYPPVSQLIILTADANGDAQLVQGVPSQGAGLLVQGVGLTGCLTSNTITIQ